MLLALLFFAAPDKTGYDRTITPFLTAYCAKCHIGPKSRGEFSVDASKLSPDFSDAVARGRWREVVNALHGHEMPPKKEKQPTPAEVAPVVDWTPDQAVKADLARRDRGIVLR